MQYYSTNSKTTYTNLQEAILHSMAPDGGVYMPLSIPVIPKALFKNIADMSLTDIAYVVCSVLFGSDIAPSKINEIVKQTLNFDIPLRRLDDNLFALELFHGSSGSFKEIGTRFLAQLIKHYISSDETSNKKVNVLVATSGDTGCAVAQGFAGIENINVFILHPKGRLLRVPSDDFLSPAPNVIPISVRGTFEDCQMMVRQAYSDEELNRQIILTSANSINIARLLPQIFYLFYAYAGILNQVESTSKFVMAMPCGNLGNLTASLFAIQMGLPIERIMAAGYGDERLWGCINKGQLALNEFNTPNLNTNLSRINCLIRNNSSLASKIDCYTYNDKDIADQIKQIYQDYSYLMDRNTAMASRALSEGLRIGETGVFLATANPAKYSEKLHELLGKDIDIPYFRQLSTNGHKSSDNEVVLPPQYHSLKNFLIGNNIV